MREANARAAKALGLSEDELAFYDALETNDSAVQVLGRRDPPRYCPPACRDRPHQRHHRLDSAREPFAQTSAGWSGVILRRHGYPPDKQEKATNTVLEQAEALSKDWVAA